MRANLPLNRSVEGYTSADYLADRHEQPGSDVLETHVDEPTEDILMELNL